MNTRILVLMAVLLAPFYSYSQQGMGVGNSNPQEMLDVTGAIKIGGTLVGAADAGSIRWNGTNFQGYNGVIWINLDGGSGDSDWTISGTHMYSGVTGNVGIGTTSPLYAKLSVVGTGIVAGFGFQGSNSNRVSIGSEQNGTTALEANVGFIGYGPISGGGASRALSFGVYSGSNWVETIRMLGSGNVGIGTTTPDAKLEVAGQIKITGGSPAANRVLTSDAAGLATWTDASTLVPNDGDWTVSGNNIYNANTGNVGIGTSAPITGVGFGQGPTLHIEGGEPSIRIHSTGAGNADWEFGVNSLLDYLALQSTGNPASFNFTPAGNFGIGTTTPDAKLDIYSPGASTEMYITKDGSQTSSLLFRNGNSGAQGTSLGLSTAEHFTIQNNISDKDIIFNVNDGGVVTDLVALDASTGRVGIGTITPDYLLDVDGDMGVNNSVFHNGDPNTFLSFTGDRIQLFAGSGSSSWIDMQNSATEMAINENGVNRDLRVEGGNDADLLFVDGSADMIGISTNTPSATLDVEGTFQLVDGTEGANKVLTSDASGNAAWVDPNTLTSNDGDWTISGTDQSSAVTGNVGIGTTTPDAKLELYNAGGTTSMKITKDGTQTSELYFLNGNNGSQGTSLGLSTTEHFTIQNNISDKDIIFNVSDGGVATDLVALDASTGRVGIGTTTPEHLLDVDGDMGVNNSVFHNGDPNTFLSFTGDRIQLFAGSGSSSWIDMQNSATEMAINENGVNRDLRVEGGNDADLLFVDGSADMIGISTNTPSATLDVEGTFQLVDGTEGANKVLTSDASGNAAWTDPVSSADNLGNHIATQNIELNGNYLSGDGDNEGIFVDGAGKVGIGHNSPGTTLHTIDSQAGLLMADNSGYTSGWSSSSSVDRFVSLYANSTANNLHYGFQARGNGNQFLGSMQIIQTDGSGFPDGEIAFHTTASGNAGAAERMRIDASGNIGIGTITPDYLLDVDGDMGVNNSVFHNGDSNTFLSFTGDRIQLFAGSGSSSWIDMQNSATEMAINENGVNRDLRVEGGNDADLLFVDGSADMIGISTNTPSATLDVEGTFQLVDGTEGANKVLTSDASGNAAWTDPATITTSYVDEIRDADADTKIQVEETADEDIIRFDIEGTERWVMTGSRLEPTNTGNSVFIGQGAGANDDLTDNRNVFVGNSAGYSNTTGDLNTANGHAALYYNTTGYQNTANGSNALLANTTGYQNTANGNAALYFNTTGWANTANGYAALYYNTTGEYNTANGYEALYLNTTGFENTANGTQSLYLNTTGFENTANGTQSLYLNTTGFENTANGYAALYYNTTGSQNTANGTQALYRNTTGAYNTANGYRALFFNTTGGNNTALGQGAGYAGNTNPNTTGSNNTYIGYNSGLGSATQRSNATAIGYEAKVNASNAMVLGGTGANAVNVGIGTTTPNATLDVEGTFQLVDGSEGANKVLTSDASGNAAWTDPVSSADNLGNHIATQNIELNGNHLSGDGDNEGIFVDGAGNVGIGTTSPLYAKLSVVGTGAAPFTAKLTKSSNNVGELTGIGFGSQVGLSIVKSGVVHERESANGTGKLHFLVDDNVDGNDVALTESRMTIDRNGLVGIGTTTPNAKLDVDGGDIALNDGQLRLRAGNDGNHFLAHLGGSFDGPVLQGFSTVVLRTGAYGDASGIFLRNNRVGVGIANPTNGLLHVEGFHDVNFGFAYFNGGASTGFGSGNVPISIWAQHRIATSELQVFSDARIKDVIGLSNASEDLSMLMGIEVTNYTYKDKIGKGNSVFKKVVAQQLEEVYPIAVSETTNFIPDVYQLADIQDGIIALSISDLEAGDRLKLLHENGQIEIAVVNSASEEGILTSSDHNGNVFVYGREVNDFRTVDYEAISMLNVSATQELVKRINQLEEENSDLKTGFTSLKAEIQRLKDWTNFEEGANK